jgi:hypothetical protein
VNTNRTLGLLAALVVTAVQVTVLAVDSRGTAPNKERQSHYDARTVTGIHAEAQVAYRDRRGLVVG